MEYVGIVYSNKRSSKQLHVSLRGLPSMCFYRTCIAACVHALDIVAINFGELYGMQTKIL